MMKLASFQFESSNAGIYKTLPKRHIQKHHQTMSHMVLDDLRKGL